MNDSTLPLNSHSASGSDRSSDIFVCSHDGVELQIHILTRLVTINGVRVPLTRKEVALMLAFTSSAEQILSKEIIMTDLFEHKQRRRRRNSSMENRSRVIDVYICNIRKKFAMIHPDAGILIETVWGRGYKIRDIQ